MRPGRHWSDRLYYDVYVDRLPYIVHAILPQLSGSLLGKFELGGDAKPR